MKYRIVITEYRKTGKNIREFQEIYVQIIETKDENDIKRIISDINSQA